MTKTPHSPDFVIDATRSSDKGRNFYAKTSKKKLIEKLVEDERPFTYQRYAQEVSPPVPLPTVNTDVLAHWYERCLDMPLRLAGDEEYALPEEWDGLYPLIKKLISVEHQHNPHWKEYNTYLTIDCKEVKVNEQQRHGGLHVDGFQGERINPKHKITRNYVVTTNGGTQFYPQKFVVLNPHEFNVFQGWDLQADDYIVASEQVVHFMNCYSVHESGFASRDGLRTFLRLTYDVKPFDRLGNTHNSMLDYDWEMFDRKVHGTLKTPRLSDIEKELLNPSF